MDQMCHRLVGQQCDFKCNRGYKKKEGVLKLLCQDAVDPEMVESQPKWDDETACEGEFMLVLAAMRQKRSSGF